MPLITFEHVAAHLADVTAEQIGKCHKIYGPDNREFYKVENERGELDLDGQVREYAVRYSQERGFTCTCPSGANAFSNVRHLSGVCKHVRWTVAAALEERAYLAALAAKEAKEEEERQKAERPDWYNPDNETSYADGTRAHLMLSGRKEIDDATYARVMYAQPKQPDPKAVKRDQKRYQSRPFNLMR